MLKKLGAFIVTACMLFAMLPAAAGAAAQPVIITLTVGSTSVLINGESIAVEQPFVAKGTTMVPLRVITEGFGAGLALNKKTITLTYNSTDVVLTIGSKTVMVNGKAVAVAVEPQLVHNVTMVPLRVISEAFGATITLSGKVISLVGFKAGGSSVQADAGSGANTNGINPDEGKTHVGDSYYGWSVDYPSDLSMSSQSDNGDTVIWSDGSGNPSLIIRAEHIDQEYTREELRDYIQDYFNDSEFILEKKTIHVDGLEFEKIVTQDRKGWFFEYRATQKDNRVYIIMSGAKSDSRKVLDQYQLLLDSFRLSFDNSDKTLKDITKVENGFMRVDDKDYGLSVKLPVNLVRDEDTSYPSFGDDDLGVYFDFTISSVQHDETVEQLRQEDRERVEADYNADYLRNITESTVDIGNGTAFVLSYEDTYDQKRWYKNYDLFYVSGAHKYEADFFFDMENTTEGETTYEAAVASMKIDTDYVDKNFSEIDEQDDLDTKTVTKSSKKYDYSIELPQSWNGVKNDFEKDTVNYTFKSGLMDIYIGDEMSAFEFEQALRQYYSSDSKMIAAGATVKNSSTVTLNGMSVTKLESELPKAVIPMNTVIYIFPHGGHTYLLEFDIYKAKDTKAVRDSIQKIVESFSFTS